MNKEIETLLYSIGLSENYAGFRHTATALEIALQDPDSLLLVTKLLYPETARRCDTSWTAVERNIRSMRHKAWTKEPGKLQSMAECSLISRPTPAQFLSILAHHLNKTM